MAFTPWPFGDGTKENPSIVVSNDGQTWQDPPGITNPIDGQPAGGYNADPELVYDGPNDRLICYWASWDGVYKSIVAKTSTDGVTWSDEIVLFTAHGNDERNDVSPSVRFVDGIWKMWVIDHRGPNRLLYRTATDPVGTWSVEQVCTVNGIPSGRDLWHPMVFVDHAGTYRMLVSDADQGTPGDNGRLLLAHSGDGLTWTIDPDPVITLNQDNDWEKLKIYRSTCWVSGNVCRVWYSGIGQTQVGLQLRGNYCRIAYTEWPMTEFAGWQRPRRRWAAAPAGMGLR